MRVNKEIRASEVRLIGKNGAQIGVVSLSEALAQAEQDGVDLVEISPSAKPPVCKIIDYGKYRYQLTRREKEQKKAQHHAKLKEIKFKPNIDEHDLKFKIKHAEEFLSKGNKVKVTCMFRGREMAHPEIGQRIAARFIEEVGEEAQLEMKPKQVGRNLSLVLAPVGKK